MNSRTHQEKTSMKWSLKNIRNIFSSNRSKKEKSTKSGPSLLNTQARKMLFKFYDKRSEMDRYLSEIDGQKHFIDTTTSDEFTEEISKPVQEEVGIIGGTYAIVNHLDNRIWFLRNRSISDRRHKQFPFFEIPANGFFGDSQWTQCKANRPDVRSREPNYFAAGQQTL